MLYGNPHPSVRVGIILWVTSVNTLLASDRKTEHTVSSVWAANAQTHTQVQADT